MEPQSKTPTRHVFRRQHITTERKKQIIEAAANKSLTEVSKLFKIPRSTCQSILRNKKAILDAINNGIGLQRARLTKGRNTSFDNTLLVWVKDLRHQNVLLTPAILRERALELAAEMQVEGFQASNGWLDRFQDRNGIVLHRSQQSESGEIHEEAVRAWQQNVLHKALSRYDPSDVFSVDESEIYWQVQPVKSTKEEFPRVKERITVLIGSNMTGTEKLPLLIVGNPEKLDRLDNTNLPIAYVANERAWMTEDIFTNWIIGWNENLRMEDRRVLLYVDRCQAHPKISLSNIRLKFFLSKMSSSMQPINQGILQSLKLQYRRSLPQPDPALNVFIAVEQISLLTALACLSKAWEHVTEATIVNCFRKSGFVPQQRVDSNLSEEDSDDGEFINETAEKSGYKTQQDIEAVSADEDSNETFSTSSALILAEIAKVCANSEPLDQDETEVPRILNSEALSAFVTVRNYINQNSNDPSLSTMCDIIQNFLEAKSSE